jgi:hypothetical protein
MNNISPVKFDALVSDVVEELPKRTKIVIVRRFGLKNGKRETLEAIGQDYGITRERVRQIENDALRQLGQGEAIVKLSPAFQYLEDHFREHGHVQAEHSILQHLTGADHPHPARQAIVFVLTVGEPFHHESESDKYHANWATNDNARKIMASMLEKLVSSIGASERKLWSQEELFDMATSGSEISKEAAESYLDVSKEIGQNVFGEYGLADWPEIFPRGVRDKAYLVMRREKKPLHFSDITERINDAKFSQRKAYVQTVHNELIKDKRFVLVGRGLYALAEWGYAPGTVKDVLVTILRERGPMTKDEILQETMKRRLVRPNTVILNLQNPKLFTRIDGGRYSVV